MQLNKIMYIDLVDPLPKITHLRRVRNTWLWKQNVMSDELEKLLRKKKIESNPTWILTQQSPNLQDKRTSLEKKKN